MGFIEFTRSEILLLSKILRLVRKETGLPLRMQSENFLTQLDTAITACRNSQTHGMYQEFLDTFSQPKILAELGIIERKTKSASEKTMYRGRTLHQEQAPATAKPAPAANDTPTPPGKRKVVYRGQVKFVDK